MSPTNCGVTIIATRNVIWQFQNLIVSKACFAFNARSFLALFYIGLSWVCISVNLGHLLEDATYSFD